MKLLNLRLSNLNSLYGEWSIYFEHREYVANGLFAITGPTGAGKSTILDAISLALYGKTPRLNTISKEANEIMSRDCGDCFAEVTFRSSKGTFRAHWSQRRARSKASGALQSPQHELTDAITQRVVTAKKMETLATIQDCVGLDYEQFMRSIMLAQGEFAAFLKSDDSKRASILAKITGTDIYARIGMAVYQRFRTEADSLAAITHQSTSIELLADDQLHELHARIDAIEHDLEVFKASHLKLVDALRWFERDEQLRQELAAFEKEYQNAKVAVDAALPLRNSLANAQRGIPLQRTLESFRSLRSRIQNSEKLLAVKQIALTQATDLNLTTSKQLEKAKQEVIELKRSIESSRPKWSKTCEFDIHIANLQTRWEETRRKSHSNETKRQQLQREKLDLESKLQESKRRLAQIQSYQQEHQFDSELVGLLPKVELLVSNDSELQARVESSETQLDAIHRETLKAQQDCIETKGRQASLERAISEQQSQIAAVERQRSSALDGRSVDELQAEADSLHTKQQVALEQVTLIEAILTLHTAIQTQSNERDRLKQTISKQQDLHGYIEKQLTQQQKLVDALEASRFKDRLIAQLHEHRSRLIDGEPCELCGSTHHPWADGATPSSNSDSERHLQSAKDELARITDEREALLRQANLNSHLLQQADDEIRRLNESLCKATTECEAHAIRFSLDSQISAATAGSLKQSSKRWNDEKAAILLRIREASNHFIHVAQLQEELTKLVADRNDVDRTLQSHGHTLTNLDESRLRTEEEISQRRVQQEVTRRELTGIFEHLKMPWPTEFAATPQILRLRSEAWLESIHETAELERAVFQAESRIAGMIDQTAQLVQEYEVSLTTLQGLALELEELQTQRHELFGMRDPKETEHQLQVLLDEKVAEEKRLIEAYAPVFDTWQALDRELIQLTSSLATDTQQYEVLHLQLDVDLQRAAFADLHELELAIQHVSSIDEWQQQLRSIDESSNAANVRLLQKQIEVETWGQNRPEAMTQELLRQQLSDTDGSMDALRQEHADLRHRLSEEQAKKDRMQGAQLQIEQQQIQMQRWGVLNELIGSADGAKFRRFAQGITFEFLLEHANIQLRKLTDRYLLKKDEEGLGMVVIDHYQSSRSRSAANLSGGETFLVSLALALGLSKLASQNVQIDSLFLDEGFGSLDEETLDEALHTLSNLRQEGKLVGLISHVGALTQQIPVRIEVIKGSLGRSHLAGPGIIRRGSDTP